MAKVTGFEDIGQIPPKVLKLYEAVSQLVEEGADPGMLRVSTITDRAGIGKGTAYEYFDSKDEIVIYAVVYQMQTAMVELAKGLLERKTFREQMNYLLDEVTAQEGRQNSFLKLVHLLTDNSEFSRQVQGIMASAAHEKYRLIQLFRNLLGAAVERGELRKDLPLDYMVFSMGGRVLAYMIAVSEGGLQIELSRMRELVYDGILSELSEK
ncbi:MAG: TetR/AcrR family transcriptional regulator [Acetatifactor sp.]|nr:TetR/AcrR family transcriptional regulator [Acetatifactor sp.]